MTTTETGPIEAQQKKGWIGKALAVLALAGAVLAGAWHFVPFDRETRLRRLNREELRRAALAHPNDAELFLELGRRFRQSGELHKAFVMTERAYELRGNDPRFAAAMVGALVDAEEEDAAYRLVRGASSRWKDSGEVRAQFSRVYAGRGYFADALREAEAAVRLEPRSATAWRALGTACSLNKRPSQADAAFERALTLEPGDAELLADYGEALAKYGRAAEAEARLRRSMALAPQAARPAGLLGQLEAGHARSPEERAAARALLEQSLVRAPRATDVRFSLAALDLRAGREQEAVRLLKQCLAEDPRYGEAYLALGQAYQKMGQREAARQAFAAWRQFSDDRREVGHLELRLRRDPRNVELLRRLARLHAAQGRRALAEEYQRRIQTLQAGTPAPAGTAGPAAGNQGAGEKENEPAAPKS